MRGKGTFTHNHRSDRFFVVVFFLSLLFCNIDALVFLFVCSLVGDQYFATQYAVYADLQI